MAIAAYIQSPRGVYQDSLGDIYFVESQYVRKISAESGVISTVAGGGNGYQDGILANTTLLDLPWSVTMDMEGGLYITDFGNCGVRAVDPTTQIIETVVNRGPTCTFAGDGGLAQFARLNGPTGLFYDEGRDRLFIADSLNHRIRVVALYNMIID